MPLVRKPTAPVVTSTPNASEILQALASGNPEERWSAARAAAQIEGSVESLAAALLTESEPRVREAIFTSLSRIGTPASVNAILPMLRVDDARLRTAALDALCAMVGAVHEHLPTLLSDPDRDVRLLSCEIARSLPSKDATHMLCALLARESDANVCAAAIEVLAEVGSMDALPALAECVARFKDTPFMEFAIKIAHDRILSQSIGSSTTQQPPDSSSPHG